VCNAEDSDEDFNGILSSLQKIWNDREMMYNNPPQFYEWFINNCKADVQKTMLKEQATVWLTTDKIVILCTSYYVNNMMEII